MKKLLPLYTVALSCIAATALQAATLIQFDFDSPLPDNYYPDTTGKEHTVRFNREIQQSTSNPFSTSHPEQVGTNLSARLNYPTAVVVGTVEKPSEINLKATNTFTMEGWVYIEGIATNSGTAVGGNIWRLGGNVGGTSTFLLGYNTDREVVASFNSLSQPGGTRSYTTSTILDLNTWHHLAYVKAGLDIKIYVNGELVASYIEEGITSRSLPTELSSITIGANVLGMIDDLRLSDTALTPEELGFHAPFTPIPEPGLSMALVGAGVIGGFVFIQRRRARR